MVSKVAVIALVAIVACPILLGYAMNLQEVTITDYETTGESVNVTSLLQNGSSYTYANANIYTLNTNFGIGTDGQCKILPIYESFSTVKTSYPLKQKTYTPGTHPSEGGAINVYDYYYFQSTNEGSGGHIIVRFYDLSNNLWATLSPVKTYYYVNATKTFYYSYSGSYNSLTIPDGYRFAISDSGGYTGTSYIAWKTVNTDPSLTYVDFSDGFHFNEYHNAWWIDVPDNTRRMIITVDLDSITDSTYSCKIATAGTSLGLYKETLVSGDVAWRFYPTTDPSDYTMIYYDNNSSNNVYQIVVTSEKTEEDSTTKYYHSTIEFRYVGAWPTFIGEANYYQSYLHTFDYITPISTPDEGVDYFNINTSSNGTSPILRVDAAEFRAFEYSVIENQSYNPSDFKTNPSTTISDIKAYGTSFVFGGNTYNVTNGNIRLGTHDIPVNGLVLSSVLVGSSYENKIGNTVVSTTSTPSTIQFNGKWSADISTISLQNTSHVETEWVAGSFGWDGMDHNFLIVGLLTSFGAFVALGIYMRRTKASLWPLLIVCGGAAVLFFIML